MIRHVLCDVWHYPIRKPLFLPIHRKTISQRFGTIYSGNHFWCPKTPFAYGWKAKRGERSPKNKQTCVEGTLMTTWILSGVVRCHTKTGLIVILPWMYTFTYSNFEKGCRVKCTQQPERYCGWFWLYCFSKKFEEMSGEAMDIWLQVLKENNKSRFDSYSVRNNVLSISHITFWDCRVHIFSNNLSQNSCIHIPLFDCLFLASI